uniref:Mannosyltransferase n=1 Tax=Heterorhabditis bacteriophora TaxID=37862 RepID=A0A1I7WBT5_HETBA
MLDYDESFGYSTALLSVAPLATQLGLAPISWIFVFPVFALPALSLLLSIGHLSTHGPVLTFRRIAPIAAGIGWAFTWHVSERLYVEGLRAAQNLLYILFSMRTRLDWALDCHHSYNSQFCTEFNQNVTTSDPYEYPNHVWPAQEFNSYFIRGNPIPEQHSFHWKPNEWFLGISEEKFSLAWPSMPLMIAHAIIWTSLYFILVR